MHVVTSLSKVVLQVHSNVLTGSVPGYLLGQTLKALHEEEITSSLRAITRPSLGQPPVGSGRSMGQRRCR